MMIRFLFLTLAFASTMPGAWLQPADPGVRVWENPAGGWIASSAVGGEFALESDQRFSASHGDAFAIEVRIRVGVDARALPELVCYDAQDREIPSRSALAGSNPRITTDWQLIRRVFPARPGTASVRARVRAQAQGEVLLVQIDYFVANTDSRPAGTIEGSMASKVTVKSIALKVQPTAAIAGAWHETGRTAGPGALVQKTEDMARLETNGHALESPARLRGWLAAALAGGGSLGAGIHGFREQFPKALRWNARELEIALWAPEGGDYDWIEGVGKTHHVSLYYGREDPAPAELLAEGPVLALADPQWYAQSGVFGPQTLADESGLPVVERTLAAHMKETAVGRVGLGFENYGDHSSGGYIKGTFLWDKNEYDLPAGCMVHFVRTGDRAALRVGLAGALHYLDIDTIHYSSRHADWARAHHVHSHAMFGGHTAQGPDLGHAGYVQGLIWYDYFMGESIGVLGSRGIADWILRNLRNHTSGMERGLGHSLMTLNDVYEATGDERYLQGAARLVDQALKWEHPQRSGFLSAITEFPAYYSGSPFCSGLLPSALMKFNGWARLPEVDRMLQRVAQWTLTDVWRPPVGLQGKGGSPRRIAEARHIASHGRLMALQFERTQDPFFFVVPWKLVGAGFGEGASSFGSRATGLVYNYLPWFLATIQKQENPEPEPQLEVRTSSPELDVTPGGTARICVTLRNAGSSEIRELRVSLRSRVDFAMTPDPAAPVRIGPGKAVELWHTVQAPIAASLASEYDRIAYAHWSALYRRNGKSHLAYQGVKLTLRD